MREYSTNEDFLRAVKLPEDTESYEVLSHGTVIDIIEQRLFENNHEIKEVSHRCCLGGNVAHSKYIVNAPHSELGMEIDFLNSYDKSRKLMVGIGANVFLCSNGMLIAEHGFKMMHRTGINQLFDLFTEDIVDRMEQAHLESINLMERMRNVELNRRRRAEIIGRLLLENEVIAMQQVAAIEEAHKKTEFNKETLWDLYNNVTEVFKDIHPMLSINRHKLLSDFSKNYIIELEGESNDED